VASSEVVGTPGWVGTCPSPFFSRCRTTASWPTPRAYQKPNRPCFPPPFLIPMQTVLEPVHTVVLSHAWGWQTPHERAGSKRLRLRRRPGCPFPADDCQRAQCFAYEFGHVWTLRFTAPLVRPPSPRGAGRLGVPSAQLCKECLTHLVFRLHGSACTEQSL